MSKIARNGGMEKNAPRRLVKPIQ